MRKLSSIRDLALRSTWPPSRELEKVDDEKNLKIAQDAVDGKFRAGTKRRRRGIDGAASDGDTSDEEGLRRAKPPKKRNIAGDTLPTLGKCITFSSQYSLNVSVLSQGSCYASILPSVSNRYRSRRW